MPADACYIHHLSEGGHQHWTILATRTGRTLDTKASLQHSQRIYHWSWIPNSVNEAAEEARKSDFLMTSFIAEGEVSEEAIKTFSAATYNVSDYVPNVRLIVIRSWIRLAEHALDSSSHLYTSEHISHMQHRVCSNAMSDQKKEQPITVWLMPIRLLGRG